MSDPYEVLGVPRDADAEAIRKAYKQLARKYHPDRNKAAGAESKFKEVNAANDILGDDEKRKLYDEFGEDATRPGFDADRARAWARSGGRRQGPGGSPHPGGFSGGFGFDFRDGAAPEDLFGSIFGDALGRRQGARRGRDQQATISVDPLLSFTGGETALSLARPTGEVENLKVRIPPGVSDGGTLRLKGQGLPPPAGGPCGDLLLRLQIAPHPRLRRDGEDLEMDLPITVLEAMRGASISVPTPTGEIKVTIPPSAAPGARLRIKGRGVQKPGKPGDLYLLLRPIVPETTDPKVIEAAETIERAYGRDVRAGLAV